MPQSFQPTRPVRGAAVVLLTAAVLLLGQPVEASEGVATLDCETPSSWSGARICASSDLSDLKGRIASAYDALHGTLQDRVLQQRLAADRRDQVAVRTSCRDKQDEQAQGLCLTALLRGELYRLDLQRHAYLGPALPSPPLYPCSLLAGNQIEIRSCLADQLADLELSLEHMDAAAGAAMAELDAITSAEIDADAFHDAAARAFESYRQTACDAVGASYAGGSGTGIAILSCRLDLAWRRLLGLRRQFVNLPDHWADGLQFLDGAVLACLATNKAHGKTPRITDIWEVSTGAVRVRIADSTGKRRDCELDAELTVVGLAPVADTDQRPTEGLALFFPTSSTSASEGRPPLQPGDCRSLRWFTNHDGSLQGWLALDLCLSG